MPGQPDKKYHWKGVEVYRIVHNFIDQAGTWTDSVYGGTFADDEGGKNRLKHDKPVSDHSR
jgi:hypothetical protein